MEAFKLLTIPSYKLSYYTKRPDWMSRILESKSQYVSNIVDNVEGILFPGFYGDNPEYEVFYRENLMEKFTPPRGNLGGEYAVIGIAPGYSDKSFGESVMLFGPSSEIFHRLLAKLDIYPYFTNLFKEPYEKNRVPSETSEETAEALALLKKELSIILPKTVIFLGKYPHYEPIKEFLSSKNQKHVTIYHPSYVNKTGTFDEWFVSTKQKLMSLKEEK